MDLESREEVVEGNGSIVDKKEGRVPSVTSPEYLILFRGSIQVFVSREIRTENQN